MSRRAVIALGGNALLRPGQVGERDELTASAAAVAEHVVTLLAGGWRVLLVHGNGPQVGIELIRSEEASTKVPPFGLDLCVANTQGAIAALLEVAIRNALREERMEHVPIASLVSLVHVDADDPAFSAPTKPIGPFYSGYRRRQIEAELDAKGWAMVEDAGRGWRTVVPSPKPSRVLSQDAVTTLLEAGFVVIGGGGGGVPVTERGASGALETLEAVIDKDRTAAILAQSIEADLVVFLTGVPWVETDFGTPFARRLDALTPEQAEDLLAAGQFPAGSMGPKIEAACAAAREGSEVLITSADALRDALLGRAGTRITTAGRRLGDGDRQLLLELFE